MSVLSRVKQHLCDVVEFISVRQCTNAEFIERQTQNLTCSYITDIDSWNCKYNIISSHVWQGNVVLVDTPGIKEEDDDDNSQLFSHLQKASAFIYILKTDSNLGTHKVEIKACICHLNV